MPPKGSRLMRINDIKLINSSNNINKTTRSKAIQKRHNAKLTQRALRLQMRIQKSELHSCSGPTKDSN